MVVVLDACRADKIGCYGFDRPTTPELDELSRDPDAVVFKSYYVQSSWTKPSTASLFTGLFVHQHGVRTGHEPKPKRGEQQVYVTDVIPEKHVTMAERLKKLGYRTFAAVKGENLNPRYGYGKGFDEYVTRKEVDQDPERLVRFLELARESPGKFFGYVHMKACHNPFEEGERDADYMRRFRFAPYDESARQKAGIDFTGQEIKKAIRKGRQSLLAEDVRFLNLVYEAKLRMVDRTIVGPLVEGLKEAGLYDDMLLIVTADHGEELFDHDGYAHGHAVWEELVRVPMVVKFPRGRRPAELGNEVTQLTRAIDVLPALLDFAGAPVRDRLPGVPIFRGQFADVSISEGRGNLALLTGEYKLIVDGGEKLLFHLKSDPGERSDLASKEPQIVHDLSARLDALVRTGTTAPSIDVELTPEAEANLRALGYIQ